MTKYFFMRSSKVSYELTLWTPVVRARRHETFKLYGKYQFRVLRSASVCWRCVFFWSGHPSTQGAFGAKYVRASLIRKRLRTICAGDHIFV